MFKLMKSIRHSLASKLILTVGAVLLLSISTWAYFNIQYQKEKMMNKMVEGANRMTNTIRLGAHYAMMINSRDDINQIINNIAKQAEIENIRIYNKEGQIKFSNNPAEVDQITKIKTEACDICHKTNPPTSTVERCARTRILSSDDGHRLLGIISPIRNEPGCATGPCHEHPEGKKILGALDLVLSLEKTDQEIFYAAKDIIGLAISVFLITSAIIFVFVLRFVNRPIKKLIQDTRLIAQGDYTTKVKVRKKDELGQLAIAINKMGDEISRNHDELNNQRDEYQNLFEGVPCLITVQDKNYRLLRYNNEFAAKFDPKPGDHCYRVYKGRDNKCIPCPVEKTFENGKSHETEETGMDKDGSVKHWIVRTSPIRNANGDIVAAMEVSLDISRRKQLEVALEKSEKKYHAIFSNIPNPVFVLDMETLEIVDCNKSVGSVYGYEPGTLFGRSFLDLFAENERDHYAFKIATASVINQVRHMDRDGHSLFVNIRISPSEYAGRKVLLVTTSDITKRLEAEQQLIQASKMATLGEMATGIAHELNQPLSVIKTVSSFFIKKLEQNSPIKKDVLGTMLAKVDGNVDRASNIINHMRQFARKSELELEPVQVNEILDNALDIFSRQLKVRGIEVILNTCPDLPKIKANPGRLEQVFINLLLNARDAIEDKWQIQAQQDGEKKAIILDTNVEDACIVVKISDTGTGMPESIKDKIFEPFFTTKEVGKGTGLGLSISYGIVKECGGTIEVSNQKPGGTCFTLTFPVSGKKNDRHNKTI